MTALLVDDVDSAVALLRAGGLVAVPTETVYGLAADATNPAALARIFEVKQRPRNHPLILHIAGIDEMSRWAQDVTTWAQHLAENCWPGPLTLVLNRTAAVDDVVTGGQSTVALRVPASPLLSEMLLKLGTAVAAPSANRYGRVSPTTAEHVVTGIGAALNPVTDGVLDGGACSVGVESTIVDATGERPRLLRPGALSTQMVTDITGLAVEHSDGSIRASGMHEVHYTPDAAVVVTEAADLAAVVAKLRKVNATMRIGLLAVPDGRGGIPDDLYPLTLATTVNELAADLYAALHAADDLGMETVVAVLPAPTGIGHAVRDRLLRAAGARAT